MSCKSAKNDGIITKKCGEITITMKKNAKNVFSFNCWFCDTIYAQMKKFTLHIEKEHVDQLEQSTTIIPEYCNEDDFDDKIEMQKGITLDSVFVPEVKIEDCENFDIKSEIGEEKPQIVTRFRKKEKLSLKFEDPLETIESNDNKMSLTEPQETAFEVNTDVHFKNESQLEDEEMDNISDDEHSEDESDYSGENISSDDDSKIENSTDEMLSKPLKTDKKAKEKELILALIEAYKEKPQLWNTPIAKKYNSKQKDELLKSIADDLSAKLNLKLKLYTVKTKLNFICKQYEKVIRKEMIEGENEKHDVEDSSELWYYEHLSFLKPFTENKIKNKRTKSYHKVKPLSDSVLCEIIDIYKNYNSLWDVNHIAYMVRQKRNENMQLLLEDVKKRIDIPLNVDKLEKHLQYIHNSFSKDKQLKLECESKQKDFKPTCSFFYKCEFLEAHQAPFRCQHCSKDFTLYTEFLIHKSEHDGSYPFVCQECGKTFKIHGSYILHIKRHLGVLRFCCKVCGKGYPVSAELDLHMRSHTGALPFLCSLCGERFRTAIGYDNHIRRHEKRFRYYCHICKRGFNNLTIHNNHVKTHLNIRDFICTICGKAFTLKKYLLYHMNIHGGKNYTCNICGKSYAQTAGLRQHKKTHGIPAGINRSREINS